MARPKKATTAKEPAATVATNFRFPPALVEALDAWVEKLNKANPLARRWTRTDVAQECLARAVKERGAKGEAP